VESLEKLKKKGVDTVAVVSVNDAFVLANWAISLSAGELLMLADGNGDFAKLLGVQQDLSAAGMGLRSKRFALVVKDGVVKYVGVDIGELEHSTAQSVLAFL
jgi:peroxiredoxin